MNTPVSLRPKTVSRIFAVIVLYKLRACESSTLASLLDALEQTSRVQLELEILLWDNTPDGQDAGIIASGVRYRAAPDNPGLAQAYNHAAEVANAEGYDWLLTLDQDSVLPANFLARLAALVEALHSKREVGAIVPQVTDGGHNLSPFQFAYGAVPQWFNYGSTGIQEHATYALNSAATIRLSALAEIGGYDPMFPLDVSDINLFHHLHTSGKKVYVAGDVQISHNFSLLNRHGRMSAQRYHSQLWDECAFWDMKMGPLARVERMIRLIGRVCKNFFNSKDRAFQKIAWAEIMRRLLTRRAQRISDWTTWAAMRCTPSPQGAGWGITVAVPGEEPFPDDEVHGARGGR